MPPESQTLRTSHIFQFCLEFSSRTDGLFVPVEDFSDGSDCVDFSMVQPYATVAEQTQVLGAVRYYDHGRARGAKFLQGFGASFAKCAIACAQRLVEQQQFELDVRRDGKPQPRAHAA